MQPTGGARAKARSAEPCEPASRGKEQCGAALRGHACDDISRIKLGLPLPKTIGEPHSGRRAATLRRASGAKARSAEPASGFSRVRSAIQCFQDRMNCTM